MNVHELENLEEYERIEIDFGKDKVEELSEAAKMLKNKVSWTKNVGITNKKQEKNRFLEAWRNEESFEPDFRFKQFQTSEEKVLEAIKQCRQFCKEIEEEDLEKYGPEVLTPKDFQEFFDQIFRQFELFSLLGANIENEEVWKKTCGKIWSMAEEDKIDLSRRKVEKLDKEELEKDLTPVELKEMFEAEFERLGIEYEVETRKVSGCFNIPEEQKLIVAEGTDGNRKFSREEAEMLTMHETFHSVRAFNGYKAGEKSSFPDILGVHTPFYDRTEEGGAIFREHKTKTTYGEKQFNHHLMRVAAFEVYSCDNYEEDFQDIIETLVELGATPERAFTLAARNREVLRHHIYQSGFEDWQEKNEIWPLLIGKINEEWAEKFREEVEANGMFQRPAVNEEKLFNFEF